MASHDVCRSGPRRLVMLLYAGCASAAIGSQQCARQLINSKQLDDKFPLELVFLFARHVRSALSSNLCTEASNLTAQGN